MTARQYNVRSGTDTLFTPYADLIEKFKRIQQKFGLRKAYIHVDGIGYRGYDNLEPDQIPVGEKAGGKEGLKKFLAFARENDYIVVYISSTAICILMLQVTTMSCCCCAKTELTTSKTLAGGSQRAGL